MHLADPRFPPLVTGHSVKSPERPHDVAIAGAMSGTLGAGDLVWSRSSQQVTGALVLEPDVPLARAREMALVLQSAVIEALALLMPSQTALQIRWPDHLICNGARVGMLRLTAPPVDDDDVPPWMTLGFDIVLQRKLDRVEPGEIESESAIAEEDGADITRTDLLEAIAPPIIAGIHRWEEDGIRPIVEPWIGRVIGHQSEAEFEDAGGLQRTGEVVGIDDDLALIVRTADGETFLAPYRHVIADAAAAANGGGR
ncbi:MAG: biotin/lipoate--protein ligase family protein [Pseudomonadota bacterium]